MNINAHMNLISFEFFVMWGAGKTQHLTQYSVRQATAIVLLSSLEKYPELLMIARRVIGSCHNTVIIKEAENVKFEFLISIRVTDIVVFYQKSLFLNEIILFLGFVDK